MVSRCALRLFVISLVTLAAVPTTAPIPPSCRESSHQPVAAVAARRLSLRRVRSFLFARKSADAASAASADATRSRRRSASNGEAALHDRGGLELAKRNRERYGRGASDRGGCREHRAASAPALRAASTLERISPAEVTPNAGRAVADEDTGHRGTLANVEGWHGLMTHGVSDEVADHHPSKDGHHPAVQSSAGEELRKCRERAQRKHQIMKALCCCCRGKTSGGKALPTQ